MNFPIMRSAVHKEIPWKLLEPHADQARRNHGQSLSGLARRGGLTVAEAIAVLEDRAFRPLAKWEGEDRLAQLLKEGA